MCITCRTKWAKLNGQVYKPPCAVVLGVEDDYPVFGQVDGIYAVESRLVAEVNVMTTAQFSVHYHGYVVERTSTYKIVRLSSLHSPFPLHVRKLPNLDLIIIMKHHITGTLQS